MAIINSFTFLVIVRSGVKNAVFAYCWVIVEPPWAFNDPDFKLLKNVSDAHYTITLFNHKIDNKKLLKKNCEINGLKNCHVLDGSSIASGLAYPTYFMMTYIRFVVKRLVSNDKKNKN